MPEKYSMKDVYQVIGDGDIRKVIDHWKDSYFENEEDKFLKWWNEYRIKIFDDKTPRELCQEEEGKKLLENKIMCAFLGSGGG